MKNVFALPTIPGALLLAAIVSVNLGICTAPAESAPPALDLTKVGPASAELFDSRPDSQVAIAGKLFDGYCLGAETFLEGRRDGWATWRVPDGYGVFQAYFGVDDTFHPKKKSVAFTVLLEGDVVKAVKLSKGEKAERISVPVRPRQSLRVNLDAYGVLAEPRLLPGAGETASLSAVTAGSPGLDSPPAPFAVDPRDLDSLAAKLREVSDANATAKKRLEAAQVAVATFMLIDIASKSIAKNVAEDLYTAMTNKGFQLVERGQLDKILAELKIQDTALISPQTAKKIGEMRGGDVVLVGSISDRGDFVVINARFLDTATGKSIAAQRVEMRKIPIKRE